MRFKLIVEYEGAAYHGWQIQPNGESVQAVLERAAAEMLGEAVRMTAAGRTDAGVHAAGQVVCFDVDRDLAPRVVQRGLNALTPPDVSIRGAEVVPAEFDPRRSALSRTYVYRIWNRQAPSVFWRRYAWHVARPLDVDAMRAAAAELVGEHDFSSFRAAGCDAAHAVRRVLQSAITARGPMVAYHIEATAFLRHMVRNIVGSLAAVGVGDRRAGDIGALLAARDRTRAGPTAPACGLCLLRVTYPANGA